MGVLMQIVAAILLCFSCMNMGIIMAWPSSTVLLFKSKNTTLQRPMTDVEIALLGGLPAIGAMISQPLVVGYILDRLGRKPTAMLASMFLVIAWSIISTTSRIEIILMAVFISGFGHAITLEVAIYLSEISQNSIRGTLTAGPNLASNVGCLVSYFLGGALGYHMLVYTCLTLSVIGVLMITVLKESPVNLLRKGREEDAAKSISFYRHTSSTSKEVITELNNLRRSITSNLKDVTEAGPLTEDTETVKPKLERRNIISCWQFFKTTPSIRRQFYVVIALKTAFISHGLPTLMVYAEPVFAATVDETISPNLCCVILGFITLITGILAAYLTDKVGRRALQIYSSIVTGACYTILGVQILTELLPKLSIPLLIFVCAMSHTVGSGTVPFVVATEVFLPEVKSILIVLTTEWLFICYFCMNFLFNIIVPSFGMSPMFFFFSFMCFGTTVYFYYFLPETKGLPVYAIQELFKKKNEL